MTRKDLSMFRALTDEETARFQQWARANYKPGSPIDELWHPATRAECERINAEHINARNDERDGD